MIVTRAVVGGRVHGTERIVVGDASLVPQAPWENTNIPAVVVDDRIARLFVS